MKFSENWLREHVAIDADSETLRQRLTMIGLEVEGAERIGASLDSVVVARIVECAQHPEADRLRVCKVDSGQGILQIVCGAPNARVGLVAPLAMVGAKLGEIAIKAATLRGVESSGMLCSAKEVGLDTDAAGLMELPQDAPIGTCLAQYLKLPDTVIELGITPNRADCFSVRGIAYDVAAAFDSEIKPLDTSPIAAAVATTLPIRLTEPGAPHYVGRVIESVDASRPTPFWMAERLRRGGIRPVSLLVDITQYVMLEIGQPMHAFDREALQGPISVRHAVSGETLKLLDGKDAPLDQDFLVVTDADRPVALAGVMGGFDTRVTDTTRHVFLEAAHFLPAAIIGRSRKLGLHTEAAHRFERGVDPALPRQAIEYATRLMLDLAGGKPGPTTEVTLKNGLTGPASIVLRRERLARVLGVRVNDGDVERILRRLDFSVSAIAEGWQITPPSRRFDIAIEEDVIEEVARIQGYDAIPATLPRGASRIAAPSEFKIAERTFCTQLSARGYTEAINFAFLDQRSLQHWSMTEDLAVIANPLSSELGVMRPNLLPGLISTLARNQARQQSRLRLFESGAVFSTQKSLAPREVRRIAAAGYGDASTQHWSEKSRTLDFYDLKGDLQSLASLSAARLTFRKNTCAWGHPGRSADVYRIDPAQGIEQKIGWLGELHPRLLRRLDLDFSPVAFEVDLLPLQSKALVRAGELSKFPFVRRDLAFVVAEAVPWDVLLAGVRKAAGPLLRHVQLFDRYVGHGVERGFKSLAIGLILQEDSRTLTDHDTDAVVANIVAMLRRDHNASIRDQ